MAIPIVGTIAGKVADFLLFPVKDFGYVCSYKRNIKKLKDQADILGDIRDDVLHRVEEDKFHLCVIKFEVENWLKKVDDAMKETERIIKYLTENEDRCLKGWCPNVLSCHSIGKKAKKMRKVCDDLQALGKFDVVTNIPPLAGVFWSPAIESQSLNLITEGSKSYSDNGSQGPESKLMILEEIMDALKDDKIHMIAICGIAGVGKTRMVKQVGERAKEENLFDEIVMVSVDQYQNLINIQTDIAECLGLDLKKQVRLEARAKQIGKRLKQHDKVLVILEDVWECLDLEKVGVSLTDGCRGCKVILTSRDEGVCQKMRVARIIVMRELNADEAWVLFKEMAGYSVNTPDLYDIAKMIVKKCQGSPLALVTIGKALYGKDKYVWYDALGQLTMLCQGTLTGVYECVYLTLLVRYDYIASEEAKFLFKLCCLFPKGFEIPIEELFRFAKGKQLLEGTDQLSAARNCVFNLIKDLKRLNLLLEGDHENHVKVHDIVRDFGISISSDQRGKDVFLISYDDNLKQWPNKEIFGNYTCISITTNAMARLPEGLNCTSLELLMLFHNYCPLSLPKHFFERMVELKILILRNMSIVMQAPSLGLLKNLRYLCIQDCGRIEIISTIGELINLEILSFHGSHLHEIPKEIGKLSNLKLLDLTNCEFLEKISPGVISSLVKLEELYMGSFGYWEAEEVEKRQNTSLSELEHLSYLNTLEIWVPNPSTLPKNPIFSRLVKYCITVGKENKCYKAYSAIYEKKLLLLHLNEMEFLSGGIDELFKNTEFLFLDGLESDYIVNEAIQNGFYNLKELTIHRCKTPKFLEIGNCPLPARARSLAHLTSIEITNCHGLGNLFSLSMANGLVQLKCLKVSDSEMLEEIFSEESEQEVRTHKKIIFPNLEKLKLQHLPKLTSFCKGIKDIEFPKLKILIVVKLPNIQSLFSDADAATNALLPKTVNFHCLGRLHVDRMRNLREIWGSQLHAGSYIGLRDLVVIECPNLVNLITSNALTRLYNLEELRVWACTSLEEIVAADQKDGEYTEEAQKMKILLPALTYLDLAYLPNLKYFYHNKRPSSISLKPGNSSIPIIYPHHYLFNKQVELPSLRLLKLRHLQSLHTIFHYQHSAGSLLNIKCIDISGCFNLISVITVHVGWDIIKIPQLQTLTLRRLPSILSFFLEIDEYMPCEECSNTKDRKVVEVLGTLFGGKVSFPNLSRLILEELDSIDNLWCNQLLQGSIHKISEMSVTHCHKLQRLASSSVAPPLLQLKQLLIGDCRKMEEAFGEEEIAEQGRASFSELCRLGLMNMPNLRRFCGISHEWILPSLSVVAMSNCPNIGTFSPGFVITPSLQHLLIIPDIKPYSPETFWNEFGWKGKKVWVNNINHTLWYMCKQKGKGQAWKARRSGSQMESSQSKLEEDVENITISYIEGNREVKKRERRVLAKRRVLAEYIEETGEIEEMERNVLEGEEKCFPFEDVERFMPDDLSEMESKTEDSIQHVEPFMPDDLSEMQSKIEDSKGQAGKEDTGEGRCSMPFVTETLDSELEEEYEPTKLRMRRLERSTMCKSSSLDMDEDVEVLNISDYKENEEVEQMEEKPEKGEKKYLDPFEMEPSVMEKKLEKGKEKCLDPFKVEPSVKEELSEMDMKIKDLKAEVKGLKRRMDFLNLILSYPWKAEEGQEFDFKSLGKDFSRINQLIRQLEAYPPDKFYDKFSVDTLTLQDRLLGVKEQLNRYESHIPSCLLPQVMDGNIGELGTSDELPVPPTSRSSSDKAVMQTGEEVLLQPPQEICDLAIDSVVHQVLEYFKQRSYGKIGICGSNSWKVLIVLKDLPEITSNFCVRSVSPSKYPITMTELKMEITELRTLAADHRPLLLVDIMDKQVDLHNLDFDGVATVLAIEANEVNEMLAVDLGIIMEDHLLPWKLFCNNVGCVLRDYSTLQYKAAILIEECHCHLLAIVLLAAVLKGVTDESEWELAHSELIWRPSSEVNGTSVVMTNVLRYIWERMDDKSKNCIKYCITLSEMKDLHYALLIHDWIGIGYADTEEEAKSILEGLNHSFLLEKVAGGFFRMIEEVRIVLLNIFVSGKDPAYLMQGDLGLTRIPEEMEWNVKEIHLMNNELSVLPAHPYCPFLMRLFLQGNHNLRVIPDRFFENMPMLQLLDLSYTSIKTLPDSISDLFSLQEFFLRGCDLLMKLPACMGDLTNLKVFDLEGTELIYPPLVIGEIVNLTCLNVCLYGYANHYLEAKKKEKIPRMKLSELSELIELSIEVHPEGEWWDDEVKELMNDLHNLKNLSILKLHLPNVGLLEGSICKKLSKFRFIVGHDEPPFESCVPQESEKEFKQWEKSLKHINGEDEPAKIAEVLQYANAFFLDRHWTIKKLSEFGIENMKELKFCLLVECNELETIIDGEDKKDESQIELESLQYLSIHCMKKLESICRGPVGCRNFLFRLKFLALHACPSLTTIFTLPMLYNLENLEEVVVQDCPRIKNLLSLESSDLTSGQFLPSLKKMSFLELPKLNSISSGLCIAPKLEILVIFCCPMLRSLSGMDISSKDFKAIKGEREWWDTLRWHESEMCKDEQDYLNNRFIEIERDPCLMTQLTNN